MTLRNTIPFLFALILALVSGLALAADRIDINTAAAGLLAEELVGVGESRARAIVEHREANGPFGSVDDLTQVSGIGETTLEENRERIRVE
ncbi:ComEA family DNA-binding protein [Alkalilimnicola ehrlichii]|uniref:ComEA family DNA-binding protein n=1 Tax=Alkalilimnicola ehrlichii TaxID=351052 RepID=UPI003BA14BC7